MRWDPKGDCLASASADHSVKIIDFATGKVIHKEKTPDRSNCSVFVAQIFIIRGCYECVLCLRTQNAQNNEQRLS